MVTPLLRKGFGFSAIAILVVFCCSSAGLAALLVDFKSLPISPSDPEVIWNGTNLRAAPDANGSQGNGDGSLPIASQTIGGLIIETPLTVVGPIPGSILNLAKGSTTFNDVTLILETLNSTGAAADLGTLLSQPLGGGTFKLLSTNLGAGSVELLSGSISTAVITGIEDSNAGSVLSNTITYTGGAILNALNGGTSVSGGSMTFSLLDIDNPLHINASSGRLNNFTSNANGQFGVQVIPEPTSIVLLAIGVCGLGIRRRINK